MTNAFSEIDQFLSDMERKEKERQQAWERTKLAARKAAKDAGISEEEIKKMEDEEEVNRPKIEAMMDEMIVKFGGGESEEQ
jgi:hypothetical protein